MVSQVGLNTSGSSSLPALPALTGNNSGFNQNGSIFSNYAPASTNDYSNDWLMSNMDFGQLAGGITQASQQGAGQTSFQGNTDADNNTQEAESGSSNKFKWLGAIGGILTPLAPKVVDLFKGGSFTKLFKSKALLSSCGILGVAGFGLGMLLDSCFSSKKTQDTTQNQQAISQQQQEIIRNFVNQQTIQ